MKADYKKKLTVSNNHDKYTRIIPTSYRNITLNKPVLITGFLDSAFMGTFAISYLIEQLKMHQIAFVESQYTVPAAIFIGKRFRHPFRIYSNDGGTIVALICEVPVISRGGQSIVNALIDWSTDSGVSELLLLGGIPPTSFTPPHLHKRKALLLQNSETTIVKDTESKTKTSATIEPSEEDGMMFVPDTALISGLQGALISSCAAAGLKCSAVLIPTLGQGPDPEGAAILLEALNRVIPSIKIDTSSLRQEAEMIRRHFGELLKMHQQQMNAYERAERSDVDQMYK